MHTYIQTRSPVPKKWLLDIRISQGVDLMTWGAVMGWEAQTKALPVKENGNAAKFSVKW